jgi:hypothetical protein
MKMITWLRAAMLAAGVLLIPAVPARADVIDDLRRCDHAWVEHLQWHRLTSTRSPRIDNDCYLIGKPAGQLALTINPADLGYSDLNFRARLVGTVQPGGWVRWTVDPASVPRMVGRIEIVRAGGSVDTTVRALEPLDDYCGDGVLRTFRVQLDLRPNGGTGAANGNRLEFEARSGVLAGTVTVEVLELSLQLATPARAPLSLESVRLASSVVRAVPGRPTQVRGTVRVTADPDGRTYDVRLAARGNPENASIRVDPVSMRFSGRTRELAFTLTAPAGYVGTVEVKGIGEGDVMRRASVRITEQFYDALETIPEARRLLLWEYLPDPPPDVRWHLDPAARGFGKGLPKVATPTRPVPGTDRLLPPAAIGGNQLPGRAKVVPAVPPAGRLPQKVVPPDLGAKGRGPR